MAQFNYLNELKSFSKFDDPITKGPMPRWQRKCLENSSSFNNSLNVSDVLSSSINSRISKTPKKHPDAKDLANKRTPKKSPGLLNLSKTPTPSKGSKTPKSGGDRFIPVRNTSTFEIGYFKLNQGNNENEVMSPSLREKQRIMTENLHGNDTQNSRILSYQVKAPAAPEGHVNPAKVLYSQSKNKSTSKSTRYIPQAPDRILDAPDIMDDYYLNLIDWSSRNILAVALGSSVYLWNAGSGNIEQLMALEGSDYVCSLNWIEEGSHLAVGTSLGVTQLWDTSAMKCLRMMAGHASRVSSLSWNSYILSSGARSGQIIHHDVRQQEHAVSVISAHSQEVCGLRWSPDKKFLASGGNDNMLNIWPVTQGLVYSQSLPAYSFSDHQAAVKALAWCPWQNHILASGGGTADRCIKFWNANTGVCLNSVDTKSQVCSILWSNNYKEFISGHGYAHNQLIIWKYPGLKKVAELTGHSARVLHLAMSPDGSTVLSAGADETLRLWKCFVPDASKKKVVEVKTESTFRKGIR